MEDVGLDALDCLLVKEVAKKLRLSERQVWRMIHSGEIDSIKVGHSVRVPRPALAAYIAGRPSAATPTDPDESLKAAS